MTAPLTPTAQAASPEVQAEFVALQQKEALRLANWQAERDRWSCVPVMPFTPAETGAMLAEAVANVTARVSFWASAKGQCLAEILEMERAAVDADDAERLREIDRAHSALNRDFDANRGLIESILAPLRPVRQSEAA